MCISLNVIRHCLLLYSNTSLLNSSQNKYTKDNNDTK